MFYRGENNEAQPSGFRPDKTRAASLLNGFKNIPGKACVKRVHNNDAFVNVGNYHTRKTPHTNEEEVYRYKVTAHDVLSTI